MICVAYFSKIYSIYFCLMLWNLLVLCTVIFHDHPPAYRKLDWRSIKRKSQAQVVVDFKHFSHPSPPHSFAERFIAHVFLFFSSTFINCVSLSHSINNPFAQTSFAVFQFVSTVSLADISQLYSCDLSPPSRFLQRHSLPIQQQWLCAGHSVPQCATVCHQPDLAKKQNQVQKLMKTVNQRWENKSVKVEKTGTAIMCLGTNSYFKQGRGEW